ncbi:TspO/MBR family protein [Sphingomonas sp.]|uniref:TspO/MBR family protein n=1 Tax=Sphingomonas sp. TaxID=28214 RepID=UPI002EDB3817
MEIASKGQLRLAFLRWAIVTVPFILLLGFASGRLFPSGDENPWYQMLVKPEATPPGWAFPAAWTALYVLLGLALAMIVNARGSRLRRPALILFAVQMAANLAWSPLFFGYHQVSAALLLIVVIFVLALATTFVFARIRKGAAWLMAPYLAWLCFAGILNYQIDRLNPNAETLVPGSSTSQMSV